MSKNIHDLSDEEFDDLFRDSAEKNDIGFDPEAWNKMSKKLDAASKPPSGTGNGGNPLKKWFLPALIVLLLLITGTYLLLREPSEAMSGAKVKAEGNALKQGDTTGSKYVDTDKVDTDKKGNTATVPLSAEDDKVVKAPAENTGTTKEITTETVSTSKFKTEKGANLSDAREQEKQQEKRVSIAPVGSRETTGNLHNQKKTIIASSVRRTSAANKINQSDTGVTEPDKYIVDDNASVKPEYAGEKKPAGVSNMNTQTVVSADNKVNNNLTTLTKQDFSKPVNPVSDTNGQNSSITTDSVNTFRKMPWSNIHALSHARHLPDVSLKLPAINFESPFLIPAGKPRENTAFRRGFNIRLALSPDFSFIPSNQFFKVGNNWAAILEYRLSNRLSIQSGVIRSMKLYNALPSQYEWNSYWIMPSPLKDIDATCKMLDIPLNIRYDISQKSNSRWFIGAGFTSYIMLKEEYRYNYENPTDPNIRRRSWEGKTGTYPFSVLNLSAGYERQVFRRLTFQAEPFFKAPLGKVGYGKVRLATAGVFFSVKYPF
jgi:hypothetical protein